MISDKALKDVNW